MPNGAESYSTVDLLTIAANPEHTLNTAAFLELNDRIIKQGDADDNAQSRGGIRPGHAPILP